MNKFICFAVLAFAAYASAASIGDELNSESILNPDDFEETAGLVGDKVVFSDFCRQSRDYVVSSIKGTSNKYASFAFNTIMSSAEEIGRDVLNTQSMAVDRLGRQLANPEAQIEDAKTDIEQKLVDAQKTIRATEVQPKTLIEALKATVAASADIVASRVGKTFDDFKENLGVNRAIQFLQNGCDRLAEYDQHIQKMFEESKAAIVAQNPEFANVKMEEVACVTSRRVVRGDQVCDFAKRVQEPVSKLLSTRAQ